MLKHKGYVGIKCDNCGFHENRPSWTMFPAESEVCPKCGKIGLYPALYKTKNNEDV